MAVIRIEMNDDGWEEVVKAAIEKVAEPAMVAVAEACNAADGLQGGTGKDEDQAPGYEAGTEGSKPLREGSYRATAITATYQAMERNAANNTLVNHFHLAGGAT